MNDYIGYATASLEAKISDKERAHSLVVFEAYSQFGTDTLNIPVFREWLARHYQAGADDQPVTEDQDIRSEKNTDQNLISKSNFKDLCKGTCLNPTPVDWITTCSANGVLKGNETRGDDDAYVCEGLNGQGDQSYDLAFEAGSFRQHLAGDRRGRKLLASFGDLIQQPVGQHIVRA